MDIRFLMLLSQLKDNDGIYLLEDEEEASFGNIKMIGKVLVRYPNTGLDLILEVFHDRFAREFCVCIIGACLKKRNCCFLYSTPAALMTVKEGSSSVNISSFDDIIRDYLNHSQRKLAFLINKMCPLLSDPQFSDELLFVRGMAYMYDLYIEAYVVSGDSMIPISLDDFKPLHNKKDTFPQTWRNILDYYFQTV